MLTHPDVDGVLEYIDLEQLGACQLCLFDLAWAMYTERPSRRIVGLLTRSSHSIWFDIEDSLRWRLARLRMRGVTVADLALADLDERGWRSRLVRSIAHRLATEMVDDFGRTDTRAEPLRLVEVRHER